MDAIQKQRAYYAETANGYDTSRAEEPEHEFALAQLFGYLNYYSFDSLLDVGAGTGRVVNKAEKFGKNLRVLGVEPVAELRQVAYAKGIPTDQIIDGDATKLDFPDNSWDIVSAFGILHHIPDPDQAIREMMRVAKHGVFFSDNNNFGCGPLPQRLFSQTLNSVGLWRPFQWLKNGGKHDKYSEGDGIHYSYSLFNSLQTIREKFPLTYLCNTNNPVDNIYRQASHLSVFAMKDHRTLIERSLS